MPEQKLSRKSLLSEDDVTEVVLKELENEKNGKTTAEGVTDYPILEFDDHALGLLSAGVHETLQYSQITPAGGKAYELIKRFFDIVISALALLILLIPLGIVCLLIYAEDKGNPVFSQVRLTKDGKPFRMYKLRSMCMDAEARFAQVQKENKSDGLAFKSDDDPRITKIGKFIRKT
ncbi:MAG: sugar transferase, partial [Oscillospiraceae bacterium]|nr:sugar transferase [Oscillospiraceae bacterium]